MSVVLVVGSGYRSFREYLLAGVASHAEVVLLGYGDVDWQRPYITDSRTVAIDDPAALRAAALELAEQRSIDGVLTWDERSVVPAAEAAAAIGVRSMPVTAARACRDKARQREVLAAAGVPVPRFRLVTSGAEAATAAAAIGYPVVVKPRSRAASVGVRVAADRAELAAAVADIQRAEREMPAGYGGFGAGMLVEEQMRGSEISVDSWVLDGEVTPFVVAHKRLGFPPYFVETGHVVAAPLAEPIWRRVKDVVTEASLALGVDRCITHTELMLTTGGPRIVEVNGRLGGDLIPYLGELTTPGQSVGGIAAQVSVGVRPEPQPAPGRVAGVHFAYPVRDLRFESLAVTAELRTARWLAEIVDLGTPGQELRIPPAAYLDRAGYCIVLGTDYASVSHRLDQAAKSMTVVGTSLAMTNDVR